MPVIDKNANAPAEKPKARKINVIQTKTFCFKPKTRFLFFKQRITAAEIDVVINQWLRVASLQGKNPMPAKAFSNHRTGEVFVFMAYMEPVELPQEPDPKTDN